MWIAIVALWAALMWIDAVLKAEGISFIDNLTLSAFILGIISVLFVVVWTRR